MYGWVPGGEVLGLEILGKMAGFFFCLFFKDNDPRVN